MLSLRSHLTVCGVASLILLAAASRSFAGDVLFVDDDAAPGGDGTTWDKAYRFLQDALTDASGGGGGISEIRVGQGTYKPDRDEANPDGTGDREATFELIDGVALMGGYAGIGAKDPDSRDVDLFKTILSGDLLGDDDVDFLNNDENSTHVVTLINLNESTTVDGLVITSGNANLGGEGDPLSQGGGMWAQNSHALLKECSFIANQARLGGGLYATGELPVSIASCTFSDNQALIGPKGDGGNGGGIFNTKNLDVTGSTFESNTAERFGGGMYNSGSAPTLQSCSFIGNFANLRGGGIDNSSGSDAALTDCAFTGNIAGSGGGISNVSGSDGLITGCLFSDNAALGSLQKPGGGIYIYASSPTIVDCVFTGNTAFGFGGGISMEEGSNSVVDGCTFEANFANQKGGGIWSFESNPTITDCTFAQNICGGIVTLGRGGGVFSENGLPIVSDCLFVENIVEDVGGLSSFGGGLYIADTGDVPLITNCSFIRNSSSRWGGGVAISNSSLAVLEACTFNGNNSVHGGGAFFQFGSTAPTLINCAFVGNRSAGQGGAIASLKSANLTLINCTVSGNVSDVGGGFWGAGAAVFLDNCIVWENFAITSDPNIAGSEAFTVRYSNIEGGFAGTANIDVDPVYILDPDPGADEQWGTMDDNYGNVRLGPGSLCIDTAFNDAVPKGTTTDLDSNPRFVDDPMSDDCWQKPGTCGDPPIVDMGAYEFQTTTTSPADDFVAFRGFYDSGDLDSLLESDDNDLCYEPGIVLNPTEAPITLDFVGALPNDSPASLDVTIESSANTVGLELTVSFWNYNTESWDVVGTDTQSLNTDTVRTFAGDPADHVEVGTGEVRTRYEVRVVSFIFLFPWLDCVDHVYWTTTN